MDIILQETDGLTASQYLVELHIAPLKGSSNTDVLIQMNDIYLQANILMTENVL